MPPASKSTTREADPCVLCKKSLGLHLDALSSFVEHHIILTDGQPGGHYSRHLKCDSERPCANCLKSESRCVRSFIVRFRHGFDTVAAKPGPGQSSGTAKSGTFRFSQDQPWVKTGRNLSFVDETTQVAYLMDSDTESAPVKQFQVDDKPSRPRASPRPYSRPASEGDKSELEETFFDAGSERVSKRRALSQSAVKSAAEAFRPNLVRFRDSTLIPEDSQPFSPFSFSPESDRRLQLDFPGDQSTPQYSSPQISVGLSPLGDHVAEAISGLYLDSPRWPLEDPIEAMLFQSYLQNLAHLFDLCDGHRHFATVVPRRAAMCPPLMNAIFAASAKRLRRTEGFDPLIGDGYHQKCLDALIPALSESAATVMDENLLTAIVILRYMEELDVPSMPTETTSESHLVGTRVFIAAQEKLGDLSSLRAAVFWVALRQEIHMAFIQTRPVHPNFDLDTISRLVVPDENGCHFANLTILHCAACLRYCYGDGEKSVGTYQRLREAQDRWDAERPWIFRPMYYDEKNGIFPEVVFLNNAVVTGVLHHYLVEILLAAHNPKVPKLGPSHSKHLRKVDEEIKRNVLMVCGIAESNCRTVACYAYVCLAITMAGDRFTDLESQDALLNILVKTDTQYAWPTEPIQQYLRECWGRAEVYD